MPLVDRGENIMSVARRLNRPLVFLGRLTGVGALVATVMVAGMFSSTADRMDESHRAVETAPEPVASPVVDEPKSEPAPAETTAHAGTAHAA
ncbi:hypothetical protein D3260_15670 [Salinisphaera sp. Q1T1-3]|nr:hypothetical protein D3260_15670 [Salinisphaera sp. Q1T1-3]